jgi:hypothetical protein
LRNLIFDVSLGSCGFRDRDVLQFLIFFLFPLGDFSLKMSNAETDPNVWGNNAVSTLEFLKEKKEEEELVDNLTAPLSDLPRVDCAFAYGSGVFPQPDQNQTSPKKEVPMVDYILGVSSPVEWHSQNIQLHPNHYSSWLAYFGGNFVCDSIRPRNFVNFIVHF